MREWAVIGYGPFVLGGRDLHWVLGTWFSGLVWRRWDGIGLDWSGLNGDGVWERGCLNGETVCLLGLST